MPKENLIKFIEEKLTEGFSREEIKKTLLDTGFSLEEVEEAFKAIPEKSPQPEILGKEEVFPYQLREEEMPSARPPFISKKFILPLIILVAFIFIGGVSAFLWGKIFKPEPILLLPQETAFYARIKINPEEEQVKNLKENLKKFPYYEKFSQKIEGEFERLKEENPPLKNLDFTISDEIIVAWISQFELKREIEELPLILILPEPDLKKLKKLVEDVKKSIEESEEWKLETETYKGRIIVTAVTRKILPEKKIPPGAILPESTFKPSSTLTDGHFVLATKPEDIKKIIDVAEDQKITNIFKKDKIKNITSNPAYKKIKKYFPKEHLALFYGQFDFARILKTVGATEKVEKTGFLTPFTASLKAALRLPFFKGKEAEESEKVAVAFALIVGENELKTESYSLDLRKNAFMPSQFSLEDSLAQLFVPEKIGANEVFLYAEGRDLKGQLEFAEKESLKPLTEEEKKEFYENLNFINQFLGVDLKKDILPLFEKNYSIISASEPTGEKTPSLVFLFEIDDENKVKENLLKIKIPKGITPFELGLEEARSKARDARREADLRIVANALEIYFTEQGRYPNSLTKLAPKYISIIPTDPLTKKGYSYQLREKGRSYVLSANLEKGGKVIYTPLGREEIPGVSPPPFEEEKVSFSKEIVDGFEIYSLPIFDKFGLNFAFKEKKVIFTLTKEGLLNVLKGVSDPSQKKLKDSELFIEHFKEVPREVTSVSYIYPHGSLGVLKWATSFVLDIYLQGIGSALGIGAEDFEVEKSKAAIFEFLDRGIAPYLKVLKSYGGYSYSPEKGLLVNKGRFIFEELSPGEKKATEEFWANIKKWFEEKFGPIFAPPIPPHL